MKTLSPSPMVTTWGLFPAGVTTPRTTLHAQWQPQHYVEWQRQHFPKDWEFTSTTEMAGGSLGKHVHKPDGPPVNTRQFGTIAEFSLAAAVADLWAP